MTLKEYFGEISEDICPEECDFKRRKDIKIAFVPPPKEILGIIISCDPTTDWLEKYKKAKELPNDKCRERLFMAIPKELIKRVTNFMSMKTSKEDIDCLSNMIYGRVYWTHLHKCFTDKSEKNQSNLNLRMRYNVQTNG